MSRGKAAKVNVENTREGIWKFVERNENVPEEGKIPNFIFDNILGISIADVRCMEIVRLKNVLVSADNITSISKIYGDKYQIGDEFQEWGSLYGTVGCYPSTLTYALTKIKDILINNEISKLKKETDFTKFYQLIGSINKKIEECLRIDVMPKGIEQAEKTIQGVRTNLKRLEEIDEMYNTAQKEFDDFMAELKERRKILIKETTQKKK